MVETVLTASPEFMNILPAAEQREYFRRAYDFHEGKNRQGQHHSDHGAYG